MNTPESLREFANELVRRGLPVDYSHRAAEELADHHRDLVEEVQSAGLQESVAIAIATERLGNMKSLVKKTVREFQRRHWYGRWPVLAFFVGPIALLVLAWIATALTLVAIGKTGELIGTPLPESSRDLSTIGLIILFGLVGWCFMVIPVGVAAILARLARRSSVSHLWVVVAAAMLGLSAGYIKCGFVPSLAGADHPFVMSIPLGLPFQSPSAFMAWYASSVQQAAQTLAPLATAVLLLARDLRIRSQTLKSVKHC